MKLTPNAARLAEIRERMRIGYSGQAPEDLAWAVARIDQLEQDLHFMPTLRQRLEEEQNCVASLRRVNGNLLVQCDQLREKLETAEVLLTDDDAAPADRP